MSAVKKTSPQEEVPDYQEKWQRALAELENTRKRGEQDRESFAKYALESFLLDLLPIVDNFDRATSHIPEEQKNSAWVTGIQFIQKNLLDVLEQQGVQEIETHPGDGFDPHLHEAIATEDREKVSEEQVMAVKNKGYRLHDRVLRPAQVIVSRQSPKHHS